MGMDRITLWGFNEYLDGKLMDFLPEVLPPDTFDASILEELLYIECGDLYPYYQVPTFLKAQIRNFFLRNQDQFRRVWEALNSEYNPIENYDRIEAWSDSHSSSEQHSESLSASASEQLSQSSSESVHASTSSSDSTSSSSRGDISAYNSDTLRPQSASSGNAATASSTANNTQGQSVGQTNRSNIEARQRQLNEGRQALDSHRGRVHGNIGVTSSQQLIESSIELGSYDIYLWVVTLFQKNIISAIV